MYIITKIRYLYITSVIVIISTNHSKLGRTLDDLTFDLRLRVYMSRKDGCAYAAAW